MRKIFLTSGVILCMACPAFADPNPNSIIGSDEQTYNAVGENPAVVSNGCTESVLGVDDGTASLEAIWIANTTTVSYNCGSSNASPVVNGSWTRPSGWEGDTQTATYDAPFSHPTGSEVCSLAGYQFSAWNCVTGTSPSTENGIADGGISSGNWAVNDANVICTAVWTPNIIGLTWYNDGVQYGESTSCTYDSTIVLPPTPTKTGHTFNGWIVQPQNP